MSQSDSGEEFKQKKKNSAQFEKNFQFYKIKFARKHTEIKELLINYTHMEQFIKKTESQKQNINDLESASSTQSNNSQQTSISRFNSYSDEIQLEIDEVSKILSLKIAVRGNIERTRTVVKHELERKSRANKA